MEDGCRAMRGVCLFLHLLLSEQRRGREEDCCRCCCCGSLSPFSFSLLLVARCTLAHPTVRALFLSVSLSLLYRSGAAAAVLNAQQVRFTVCLTALGFFPPSLPLSRSRPGAASRRPTAPADREGGARARPDSGTHARPAGMVGPPVAGAVPVSQPLRLLSRASLTRPPPLPSAPLPSGRIVELDGVQPQQQRGAPAAARRARCSP